MPNITKKLSKLSCAIGAAVGSIALLASAPTLAGQVAVDINDQQTTELRIVKAKATDKKAVNKDQVTRTQIPVDLSNDTVKLGVAYNSKTKQLKAHNTIFVAAKADGSLAGDNDGDSVDDSAVFMGNTESVVTFTVDQSFEDTLSLIEGNASIAIELPTINAEGNAQLALETSSSSTSATYTLFARVKPRKAVWLPEEANAGQVASGTDMQPTDTLTGWAALSGSNEELLNNIGDEFIHAKEYGAWLMVNLRFDFHNSQDKTEIGGQLKVGYNGTVEAEGSANWSEIERSNTVSVTLTAHQEGGDTNELIHAVDPNILPCTLSDPQRCLDAFEDAVVYMKNNFVNQFDTIGNYNATRYYTQAYDKSGPTLQGVSTFNSKWSRPFAAQMGLRKMSTNYLQAKQDQQRADYLLTSQSSYLSTTQKNTIQGVRDDASQYANDLESAMNSCRDSSDVNACETSWNSNSTVPYSTAALEI